MNEQEQLEMVEKLMRIEEYDAARSLLGKIPDSPKSQELLAKLNAIAAPMEERFTLSEQDLLAKLDAIEPPILQERVSPTAYIWAAIPKAKAQSNRMWLLLIMLVFLVVLAFVIAATIR